MTAFLPFQLLKLFMANPPLKYVEPIDIQPHQRKYPSKMSGIAQYVSLFENPADCPPATRGETKDERVARKKTERMERAKATLEQKLATWDPHANPAASSDAYKTLFIGRLAHEVTQPGLMREMEAYGPVKSAKLVFEKKTGKPRGYGFVEFEHERDMNAAFKNADGKKVEGRRIVVDVERGRTVKSWRPRSLGGGLGGTRRGGPSENIKYSGREDPKRDSDERESGSSRRERSRSPRKSSRDERDRGDRGDRGDRDRDRDRDRGRSDRDRPRDDYRDHREIRPDRSYRDDRGNGPKMNKFNANLEPLGSR